MTSWHLMPSCVCAHMAGSRAHASRCSGLSPSVSCRAHAADICCGRHRDQTHKIVIVLPCTQALSRCQAVFERVGYLRGSTPAPGEPDQMLLPAVQSMQAAMEAMQSQSPGDTNNDDAQV